MLHHLLTPAAGKRLIAHAVPNHPLVAPALAAGTVVVVAGTTTGYAAEALLATIGVDGFSRRDFYRGLVAPSDQTPDKGDFPGDVVITQGRWRQGASLFDVVDDLQAGDVILKGANAINPQSGEAASLIGDSRGGTTRAIIEAVIGRRVGLLIPVGLEKRVDAPIHALTRMLDAPGGSGPRMLPLPGTILTEIEALTLLTGITATLVAGGGVCGAEGAIWLCCQGDAEQETAAQEILTTWDSEPAWAESHG